MITVAASVATMDATSCIAAATPSIAWIVVVRIWVVVWAIPATIPACVVAIVPTPVPAAIVETETWADIPPWIIVAIIPVERIIIGYVIPRTVTVESEIRVVETTDAVAVCILLNHEDCVVNRCNILGVVGSSSDLERIADTWDTCHATIPVRNLIIVGAFGQFRTYDLFFRTTTVVAVKVPVVICIG